MILQKLSLTTIQIKLTHQKMLQLKDFMKKKRRLMKNFLFKIGVLCN